MKKTIIVATEAAAIIGIGAGLFAKDANTNLVLGGTEKIEIFYEAV